MAALTHGTRKPCGPGTASTAVRTAALRAGAVERAADPTSAAGGALVATACRLGVRLLRQHVVVHHNPGAEEEDAEDRQQPPRPWQSPEAPEAVACARQQPNVGGHGGVSDPRARRLPQASCQNHPCALAVLPRAGRGGLQPLAAMPERPSERPRHSASRLASEPVGQDARARTSNTSSRSTEVAGASILPGAASSRTSSRVPTPGVLSTTSSPPRRCTSLATIASPRPNPL